MPEEIQQITSARKKEITSLYFAELDKHILELRQGRTDKVLEIREVASILHLHPVHLSNTIKEVTGKSTCYHFEIRLVQAAKELLLNRGLSIGQVASQLTYDPSNFTKFFKQYTGITPKSFRATHGV